MSAYVSNLISREQFKYGVFNVIASGTGTGKTEFIRSGLLDKFPEVKPCEVLCVTSRSMIRDQQSELNGIDRIKYNTDRGLIEYWAGIADEPEQYHEGSIPILNLSEMVYLLDNYPSIYDNAAKRIKIAVFDECHALSNDDYISGLIAIRLWIRSQLPKKEILIIGLTATPDVLFDDNYKYGNRLQMVSDDYIVNYKAKNLICTTEQSFMELYNERYRNSKCLVLCTSLNEFGPLIRTMTRPFAICSRYSDVYSGQMDTVRQYIIDNKRFPDNIDTLITTSTMREGVNIDESSGVKTVICFSADVLNIIQFAGRCRFNIENLVVVYKNGAWINANKHSRKCNELFKEYVADPTSRKWYDRLSSILDCPFEDIERYKIDRDRVGFEAEFIKYTNKDVSNQTTKQEIVRLAERYRILDNKNYTFNSVRKHIVDKLGYTFDTKRVYSGGTSHNVMMFQKYEEVDNDAYK